MSIVAILSQHSKESEVIAEHTATQLGYRLVLMDDLVKATADTFNTSKSDLSRALQDRTLRHRLFPKEKMKHIALLEQKLCELMTGNDLVFCGYLGYPIFHEVSHVLKVLVLLHHGYGAEPPFPTRSGNQVLKWFKQVYHAGMEDPNLYDLTLNLAHMDTKEGSDIILSTLQQKRFKPMTYSVNCMSNLELASRIKTALVDDVPDVEIKAHDGLVYLYSRALKKSQQKKALALKESVMRMEGVNYVEMCKDRTHFNSV